MSHDHRFAALHRFEVAEGTVDYELMSRYLGSVQDDCDCYEQQLDAMADSPGTTAGFVALVRSGAEDVMGPTASTGLRRTGPGGFDSSLPEMLRAMDESGFDAGHRIAERLPQVERRRIVEQALGIFIVLLSAMPAGPARA